ncbi:PepSY domain-containing protein [Corallincola luteus]|uniref:PepSY domain-containing protein n=1 Tax=Corallincola luteus TaxID=1775177 RepID=A0ABY2AJK4_9GAMM|nr:PepSY domain-containing protein [Corallincola luteus]TCI02703.1 PepSY domain-containing protein [Corallincola luteus]
MRIRSMVMLKTEAHKVRAKTKSLIRKIHKWLGLVLGLQLLLWILGGLYMSAMPIDTVRGRDLARSSAAIAVPDTLFHVEQLLENHSLLLGDLKLLQLRPWLDRWVYEWADQNGVKLFDASTGGLLSPLSDGLVRDVANQDYTGAGRIVSANLLTELPWEVASRGQPLWQVKFDDSRGTHLYIDPDSGKVVARRNTQWRIFDILWRAHIMDYTEGEDFNNPLLIVFAATALIFTCSGLCLLCLSIKWRRRRMHSAL